MESRHLPKALNLYASKHGFAPTRRSLSLLSLIKSSIAVPGITKLSHELSSRDLLLATKQRIPHRSYQQRLTSYQR